jgi:hypothetical protein
MKIKYVGVKEDGETAFAQQVGIERWMKGDVHDVPDALAAKMLEHPDVFAHDKAAAKQAAAPAPSATPAPSPAPSPSPALVENVIVGPGTEVKAAEPPAPPAAKKAARKAPAPPKVKAKAAKKKAK